MKTISISDDVYQHLLKNTAFIGEDASSILTRLLGLASASRKTAIADIPEVVSPTSKIDECLRSPQVLAERKSVWRFLAILAWLYQEHRKDFEKVTMIEGRQRKYFGRSKAELSESGSSVFPQKIPDSPFWVVTNNDTSKKARMLGDVLNVLGYAQSDIDKVERALR